MNNRTRELTLAAILTALSVLITFSPVKINLVFFTLTIGSHVPTMLAMFISPWVAVMTIIGSCLGFFFSTGNILVVIRAAFHILFVLVGMQMLKKNSNIFLIIVLTSLTHALAEGIVVYLLTPILVPNSTTVPLMAGWIAFAGTFVHHYLDSAVATPILFALVQAKLVRRPEFMKTKTAVI